MRNRHPHDITPSDYILDHNFDDVEMVLCDTLTSAPIRRGDVLRDFRGDRFRVTGGIAPHKPESTGRIEVREIGGPGHGGLLFFPSVFNTMWMPRNLVEGYFPLHHDSTDADAAYDDAVQRQIDDEPMKGKS